ncbi:MAG: hypothetical protein IJ727_04835 [Treponema sp.]|nr:hypothetical protein [Treponema sp.]
MKLSKKAIILTGTLSLSFLFFSCGSTANMDSSSKNGTAAQSEPAKKESMGSSGGIASRSELSVGSIKSTGLDKLPKRLTEAPKFDFNGEKLQIELENMYYDGYEVIADSSASGSFALRLENESSWAIAEINFPAGSYEGLVNVLAPDSNHSRFNVCINQDTYLVYGSEPPIGQYELTTRSVVSFTLDKATTVTLKIQQNDAKNPENKGQNGMTLDYITFKKTN